MWKQGGRSSALDRAQALLSAKRSSRGDPVSVQGSAAKTQGHTGAVGGSVKTRSAPPLSHTVLSDVSDLSSVSSAPEHGADTAGKTPDREGGFTKDLRPPSSLGGGGSRFLKKAPPPATSSSQSPVRSQTQQGPEPRYGSSSQRGSQAAALSRLAQIESRIRNHKQARQGPKPAENLTSDLGISPPPPPAAARSLEAPVQLSPQSSSDQSLRGKRFLKNKTVNTSNTTAAAAASSPKGPDVGVRSSSRAADARVPSVGLERKSLRVVSGVSLESDEEDMRKLLGDSLDSTDNSFLIPARPSVDKMLSQSSQKVHSTHPPTAVPYASSSNTAPPRSPASPSRRSSPFRFTGQAQAHFSPSVLSPSPSPPCVSPHRAGSPPRSLSSMSGRSEILSLEELFPVGPGSVDPHSEMSAVSSEDFKINVMTLDDLGFIEEKTGKEVESPEGFVFAHFLLSKQREAKHSAPVPGSPNGRQQLPRLKEKEEDQQEKEDELAYQSDFESESRTDPEYSASQISESVQGDGDGEEVVSEIREEASDSDVSRGRTEDDYSSTFSDTRSSDRSQTLSRSRVSRSSVPHGSRTFSRQSRRRASTKKVLKEAAVQTQPDPLSDTWPTGMAAGGVTYMDPSPVVAHTLSAETVKALSAFNPAVFALNEMLKQQLATTRRFIQSSRHLHSSLVRSLEPPNYKYTTLEDTKEYIRKHRPPTLTVEDTLEEVLQEMRDCHHI